MAGVADDGEKERERIFEIIQSELLKYALHNPSKACGLQGKLKKNKFVGMEAPGFWVASVEQRAMSMDELDLVLIKEDKELKFFREIPPALDLVSKVRRLHKKLRDLCAACEKVVTSPSQDFFCKLAYNRPTLVKNVGIVLAELCNIMDRFASCLSSPDETVRFTSTQSILQYLKEFFGQHKMQFLQHHVQDIQRFYMSVDSIHVKILRGCPDLMGIPYDSEWLHESCLNMALDSQRFVVKLSADNSACPVCQCDFLDGDAALSIGRVCKRYSHSGHKECDGHECSCSRLFHTKCLTTWIISDEHHHTFKPCPTCRAEFCILDLVLHTVQVPEVNVAIVEEEEEERPKQRQRVIDVVSSSSSSIEEDPPTTLTLLPSFQRGSRMKRSTEKK